MEKVKSGLASLRIFKSERGLVTYIDFFRDGEEVS